MKSTDHCREQSGGTHPFSTTYTRESGSCWLEPASRCPAGTPASFAEGVENCRICTVFRKAIGTPAVIETIDALQPGEADATTPNDLETCFFEVLGMLTKLSRGDTTARLSVDSGSSPFNIMKVLVNSLAESMQEIVDNSHEMAIGLCENYETLNRISRGDFSARTTVDTNNELVNKLGELINKEADALTDAIACAEKSEAALQTQVNFMYTLIDTIPTPVFYKDRDCRYLGCNRAFEEYIGFSHDELIGKTPHDLWPAELADTYRRQDLAMLEHPGLQIYETPVKHADGGLREVIFNKATFTDSNGAVAGLVGVILDITERKAAEEETRNAYQQLHDIVEFLPDATFVIDNEKKVIAWNRAIEKMTGLTKEEVIGKGDYIYSLPFYGKRRPILIDLLDEDVEAVRRNYDKVLVDGKNLFAETYIPSFRGGAARYLLGTATPLYDSHGNQVGGIESIRDYTAYKLAEDERKRLEAQVNNAHLMKTVVSRLGHDLRTPLTPLFILLPLIKKKLTDEKVIQQVDMCLKNAATIHTLVDKARTLATLSSGILPQDRDQVPLAAMADQALADHGGIIAQKQLHSHNRIDPAITVQGASAQIRELFSHLIANAAQFSHEQGTIDISAERHGETVLVSVQDNGIGIAPDVLDSIFDEFFKADESRHDLNTSGLGLSICKRIVLNHHGSIWAESGGTGQGTTVRFIIKKQMAES